MLIDAVTRGTGVTSQYWVDPVIARIIAIQSAPPMSPSQGDFFIDSDDDHLYKWTGCEWIDQGAPSLGDQVINLSATNQNVYQWDGTSWLQLADPIDNQSIVVCDNGDGQPALYIFEGDHIAIWVRDPGTFDEDDILITIDGDIVTSNENVLRQLNSRELLALTI